MVPKVFHTIWVQGELPDEYRKWHESWRELNPDWDHVLWAEPDYIGWLENRSIYDTAVNHAQRAEIAAKEILWRYGGVMVDADFQCLRPFDGLFDDLDCFTAEETPGQLSAGIMGNTPGHPAIRAVVDDVERSILWQRENRRPQTYGAGPHILQRLWKGREDVTVFPREMFYPYLWTQPDPKEYGDAYAVHHWKATWKG